jgi:spore coat protein CotF
MLETEKYISQAYDTAIFEFKDANIRKVLNHIQTEEQQHGEQIFNYMQSKGMYKVH